MSAIWGDVESVVSQPKYLPTPGAACEDTRGAHRIECIVGVGTKMQKGFERLNLDDIRHGDFVVVIRAEQSGWLETA